MDNSGLDWRAVADIGFDLTQLESCFAEYRRLIDYCPEARNLIHGDFGSNNVLVENGEITGVLDWDCATVGDYLYDVATAYYWSHHLICMEKQAAYYEHKLADHEPRYHDRVRCYQLFIGLSELHECLLENDPPETVNWFFERLQQVLRS